MSSWKDAITAAKKAPLDLTALPADAVGAAFTGGLTDEEVDLLAKRLGLVLERAELRQETNDTIGTVLQFVAAVAPALLAGGGIPAALGALFGGGKKA